MYDVRPFVCRRGPEKSTRPIYLKIGTWVHFWGVDVYLGYEIFVKSILFIHNFVLTTHSGQKVTIMGNRHVAMYTYKTSYL